MQESIPDKPALHTELLFYQVPLNAREDIAACIRDFTRLPAGTVGPLVRRHAISLIRRLRKDHYFDHLGVGIVERG